MNTGLERHGLSLCWPDLRQRADIPEQMDDPHCDPRKLERTYAQFEQVNALVSGWRFIYGRFIRPYLSRERAFTLLDIGCGGGDLARALQRWAAQDGVTLRVLGIDTNAQAIAYARQQERSGLSFRAVDSATLCIEGAKFDVIVSNHLLHHLSTSEVCALLNDCQTLSRGLTLHADIERGPLAYAGFGLLAAPLFHGSFIVPDGLVSVRRSFTAPELQAVCGPDWQVWRPFPFRLVVGQRASAV